ncbi:MAG: amidohydrolase/deacetylase family metallohydrolase [Roseiflexus sp.]|nr:amidohydrolase/deacetylase family metallohydrolase [Roseiflexus sp.]MCS7289740.1 amidohydrolase/deacetylase family metallohydrolase [Roseiflexus sp.]MDW8233782.1 amidohydrolase/deacetylase family metallohydrolase [Roseiflexaceae bacterium]
MYDLLICGGHVIDPANGLNAIADVAIRDGRIVAVAPSLDPAQAREVIDAAGQIVTPGLVDLHTHFYWGATYWGIEADPVAARSGVTTWVDAGSAGAYSFPGFRQFICAASRVRTFAFLNLSAIGLIAPTWEFANLDYCDVDLAIRTVEENRDLIVGIKARIDHNTTRGVGIRPLHLARALADRVALPLMVHIGNGPPPLEKIVALLRPGDILTHCFTGGTHRLLTADGRLSPVARELQQRGVLLDVGHGTGSFSYRAAEAALQEGVLPDVISSDIHQLSVQGPMFDLPTTLSKFLNLGMTLPDVIDRATRRPALAIGKPELGTLSPGAPGDVAIFRVEEGEYTFFDVEMNARCGNRRLICTTTIVGGTALPRVPERSPAMWAILPEHQRRVLVRE